MLLGELQYLLHPISVQGLVGMLASILLLKGFVVLIEKMRHVNLNELEQQNAVGKLNQNIFALTFGTRQIIPLC